MDFDFNGNVSAIELNTNEVILDPTSSCTIAGWGKTHVSIDCIEAILLNYRGVTGRWAG